MNRSLSALFRQADTAARLMVISADCNLPAVPRLAGVLTQTLDRIRTHRATLDPDECALAELAGENLDAIRRNPITKGSVVALYKLIHGFVVSHDLAG